MHLTVGIATSGRREITSRLVARLANQTRLPDIVVICPASADDADENVGIGLPFPVQIVHGARGLPAQRNTILRAATSTDVILYFDDDFIPADTYLEACERLFRDNEDVVIMTGLVIADGIKNAGITPSEADDLIAKDIAPAKIITHETYGGYGCNMAVRAAPVFSNNIVFDELLPLYGWLEDIDFSRRVAPFGRIIQTNQCRGVHMGAKAGRTSGVRFGYSQIANPIHMVRKGSLSATYAGTTIGRNLLANLARSLLPEPWVDRVGRLKGNLKGISDLLTGKLHPQKILAID